MSLPRRNGTNPNGNGTNPNGNEAIPRWKMIFPCGKLISRDQKTPFPTAKTGGTSIKPLSLGRKPSNKGGFDQSNGWFFKRVVDVFSGSGRCRARIITKISPSAINRRGRRHTNQKDKKWFMARSWRRDCSTHLHRRDSHRAPGPIHACRWAGRERLSWTW